MNWTMRLNVILYVLLKDTNRKINYMVILGTIYSIDGERRKLVVVGVCFISFLLLSCQKKKLRLFHKSNSR